MAASPEELIGRLSSDDHNDRALALAELVQRRDTAPALRAAMLSPDAEVRAQVAQALAETGDPGSRELFAAALSDSDAQVRARGAQGLAILGDPRALDALVRTIDDLEDLLHSPYTLSLYALIGMGERALPALAPLLKAPRPVTRMRAVTAIRDILTRRYGDAEAHRLWVSLGSYDPGAAQAERDRAADRWSEWVRERDAPP